MTDPQIAEIAAKLTAAQSNFIIALPLDGRWLRTGDLIAKAPRNALRGFGKSGLIHGSYQADGTRHCLTPLGQSVAAYLKEQSNAA
jgi:hypothetical protein